MKPVKTLAAGMLVGALLALSGYQLRAARVKQEGAAARQVPYFEYDETFPKPLPNHWTTGTVVGLAVDAKQHIWIVHRAPTLRPDELHGEQDPPLGECCVKAPYVIEFDYAGNVVQAWGGPSPTHEYDWPTNGGPSPDPTAGAQPTGMHSVFVDHKDNVWLTATGPGDGQILKFTRNGKFLAQYGHTKRPRADSNDIENANQASGIAEYVKTNEMFISDGYVNRRVLVLDEETAKYKRHWGAYGKRPDDSVRYQYNPNKLFEQFSTVHGIGVSNDGLVYACDRNGSRVQVFKTDGTFVAEKGIERQTLNGTVFGIAFSPDPEQRYAYIPDGRNEKIWILERKSLDIIGSFGCPGHAGGCLTTPHSIATDAKGNIYIGETWEGKRVQRFLFKGVRSLS
ncbi:MAG TPA: hypothetical protein VGY48_03780 [Vicinamibacterales bacterium]|nr:hypothetical protein [Vicinamibacterales bacterium]